jgi:hypothetical protein
MSTAVANKSEDKDAPTAPATVAKPVVKTTLEDWVGDDEDVNGFYSSHKDRPRGGRKKRKKNKATPPPPTNWDDVYDPLRPNSYEEYKEGDEKIREMEDWRERLYGKKRRRYDDSSDSEDDRRPVASTFNHSPCFYALLISDRRIRPAVKLLVCTPAILRSIRWRRTPSPATYVIRPTTSPRRSPRRYLRRGRVC